MMCGLDLVKAVRDERTFAQFQFVLSNGGIFEFGDYLQSGLPDLRDEFIKRQGPGWDFDFVQSIGRMLKTRGRIVQRAGILPRDGALRKFPEKGARGSRGGQRCEDGSSRRGACSGRCYG